MIKNKIIIFFLLISAGTWSIFLQPAALLNGISKAPSNFHQKITTIFNEEKVRETATLRWSNKETSGINSFLSKIFYNKLSIVIDEFFSYLSFMFPRIYFQAGDGTKLSPLGVEPIPTLLFPVWILGMVSLINQKKKKIFILLLAVAFLAYLFGQRNFVYLWPVFLVYLYICKKGYETIKSTFLRNSFLTLLLFYGIFVNLRAFYLLGLA